jgi:hypothetical protein
MASYEILDFENLGLFKAFRYFSISLLVNPNVRSEDFRISFLKSVNDRFKAPAQTTFFYRVMNALYSEPSSFT